MPVDIDPPFPSPGFWNRYGCWVCPGESYFECRPCRLRWREVTDDPGDPADCPQCRRATRPIPGCAHTDDPPAGWVRDGAGGYLWTDDRCEIVVTGPRVGSYYAGQLWAEQIGAALAPYRSWVRQRAEVRWLSATARAGALTVSIDLMPGDAGPVMTFSLDSDRISPTPAQRRWAHSLCEKLERANLAGRLAGERSDRAVAKR